MSEERLPKRRGPVYAPRSRIGLFSVLRLLLRGFTGPGCSWRRFDTATLALATDVTNRLFASDNPLLRLGRDIGMGVINALPGLRRGFIREAAGLTGDLPDLMRA